MNPMNTGVSFHPMVRDEWQMHVCRLSKINGCGISRGVLAEKL
jgi:hypothetical protein